MFLANLFAALNITVLEFLPDHSFVLRATPPIWLKQLFKQDLQPEEAFQPEQSLPFLDNFLIDARAFWNEGLPGHLKSGVWTEVDAEGIEYHLEATALTVDTIKVLLIEFPHFEYEEKHHLIQTGRMVHLQLDQVEKLTKRS